MSKNYKPKGLLNFAGNCYMNSLIQCLYYCIDFRNSILGYEMPIRNSFTYLIKELFKDLKNSRYETITPKAIKEKLNNSNIIFKNRSGADVTDLFDFFINSISIELKPNFSENETVDYESQIFDKKAMYEEAKKDIGTKTIIDEIFLGMYEKISICNKNNEHYKYSFQSEYRLIFPIESISYTIKNKELNLLDCFEYTFCYSEETGQKCYKNNCRYPITLYEKIYESPKILVIILDRGCHKKYDIKVNFNLEIDITKYIDDDKKNTNSNIYTLIGVSTHFGYSGIAGHYVSFCLCDDNKYYSFNDSLINKIEKNSIIETINRGSSYILFYRRKDYQFKKRIEIKSKSTKEIIVEEINKYLKNYTLSQNSDNFIWVFGKKSVSLNFGKEHAEFVFEEKYQKYTCCSVVTVNNKSSFSININNIVPQEFITIFDIKFNNFFIQNK